MPAPAGISIAQGPLLIPGFLQISQNLSFLSNPRRLEGQRGEHRNPLVRGFNHKSVQTCSISWASEKERDLEQGSLERGSKATSLYAPSNLVLTVFFELGLSLSSFHR